MNSDSDSDSDSDISRIKIGDAVTSLNLSNFDDTVTSRDFVFVYFFNLRCPVCCYGVTPEYEKVAHRYFSWCSDKVLFAKVDATKEKHLSREYNVWDWPQIKIFKNNPTHQVLSYDGPLDANGINTCLTTLMRPSPHCHDNINSSVVVGVFPIFSGYEYDNFNQVAQELQWDYEFHTTNKLPSSQHPKFLPPLILVSINNSDEYLLTKVFEVGALVKFIKDETIPDVTFYPQNIKQLTNFFFNATYNDKVALFVNREADKNFKYEYHEVAKKHRKQSINFMLGDLVDSRDAFRLFELHDCRMPIIVIRTTRGQKYVKVNLEPDDIAPWLEKYMAGSLLSESVPQKMNKNVTQVATGTFQELKLHSVIDDVANFFQNDVGVVVAKLYKKSNDIRAPIFNWDYPDLQDRPSLYFKRASGKMLKLYYGLITKDNIIEFIKKNRDVVDRFKPPEINSLIDANNLIRDKKILTVGIFPEFYGREYENFIKIAKKLKSSYDFGLTLDAKHLPLGDPNYMALQLGYSNLLMSAMLFINTRGEGADVFESKYLEVAKRYKGLDINFMLGDFKASKHPFWMDLVLEETQNNIILIMDPNRRKYVKTYIKSSNDIETLVDDYMGGKITLETTDPFPKLMYVMNHYDFDDIFKDSKINVLEDVALHFEKENRNGSNFDVKIAVMWNEFVDDNSSIQYGLTTVLHHLKTLSSKDAPTFYLKTYNENEKIEVYEGDIRHEDIIDFIHKGHSKRMQLPQTTQKTT
ncbi:hypothetical protein ACFE04_009668 [Oxalis oulophora]